MLDQAQPTPASTPRRRPGWVGRGSGPAGARRAPDSLAKYLSEIGKIPLLDPGTQRALAKRVAQDGDLEATRALFQSHLRFVAKFAFAYARGSRNVSDLVQEGNLGLLHAIRKFDPDRGVQLTTYASWWIRAYILRFAIRDVRIVRLGTTNDERRLFHSLSRERAALAALGLEVTPAAVGKRMSIDPAVVEQVAWRLASPDAAFDAPSRPNDDSSLSLAETLHSSAPLADELLGTAELRALMREKIQGFGRRLPARDLAIFEERLLADPPATLQHLAGRFRVSRQRIQQIEVRLRIKLRAVLAREAAAARTSR